MNNFKLLAVRPLENCDPNILKVLKTDQFYFFDNSYEPTTDRKSIQKKKIDNEYIPDEFFFHRNSKSSLKSINVQALVGKNGEGKSSLIELSLRIFNNYFKAKNVHEITENLNFIKDLFAELYFFSDHKIYCIRVSVDEGGIPKASLLSFNEYNNMQEVSSSTVLEKLFFVINVNYSHYSLNSTDFVNETIQKTKISEHSWLDRVFHRNDGYQTPLTLHPYRIKGNIDINLERDLINQRLTSLILTENSYEKINKDLKVELLSFEKFDLDPIQNFLTNLTNTHELKEPEDLDEITINSNLELFEEGMGSRYFVSELNKFIDDWTPPNWREIDVREFIPHNEDDFQFIAGTPIERINTFITWLDLKGKEEIIRFWVMCRAILNQIPNVQIKNNLQNTLLQYLCVKATKILRYPQYKKVNDFIRQNDYEDAIDIFIDNISSESSHVSLKFNQAFHLLKLVLRFPNCRLSKFYYDILEDNNKIVEVTLTKLKIYIAEAIDLFDYNIQKIYLNPPGILKKSIVLSNFRSQEKIELRSISSGEYQKIGMLSSIIYHLTNLDSIQEVFHGNANRYDNVILILDEIELYFHPDFQRTLLDELLTKISKVNFSQLKSINILFVTHSPFILSDIPKNNVLFIENGSQTYPMSENTFGGNIHTLLQHGFFLKGMPIGEFAKNKINELFNILNQQNDLNELPDLEKRILMVSEPFLRSQLLKLYHDRIPSKNVDILLKRIVDLENIIHDRNK